MRYILIAVGTPLFLVGMFFIVLGILFCIPLMYARIGLTTINRTLGEK